MYKAAVMGDWDSIYGFYITESLAKRIPAEIDRYRLQLSPAVILIPGISGNTGEGLSAVKKSVEQAVGSDIIFGKK